MVGTAPPALKPQTAAAPHFSSVASAAAGGGHKAVPAALTTEGMGSSAEEEAFKRNTDCVYFLASPLTCKKGSECEYRHSDIARVNPRDCWYWLHGSCLNPKCAFRHPPLEGLVGTQMPNPVGASGPSSQPAIAPATPSAYASGKQGVACIFFQKGNCLRGDWCPFSHVPNSANGKVMQSQAAIPPTEPATMKKTFAMEKCTQEKKASQSSILKPVELTNQTKLINKVESSTPAKQQFSSKRNFHQLSGAVDELPGYRPIDTRLANDGNRVNLNSRVLQPLQVNSITALNVKDAEEVSREPSPGFDVLVDNEHGDSEYYHSEDQFVRARDHDGMVEYFDGRSGDYNSRIDADRDLYRDSRAYDSYERLQGPYSTEQRRSSTERNSGGFAHQDRRRYGRADSPEHGDLSDLRHHLAKHRRVNGLRSVISHEYTRERPGERSHQRSQRDLGHDRERQEASFSNRLRGRIRIPGTSSSAADGNDQRLDREIEKGRDHSRLSPGRPQVSSRLRDRIKGLGQESVNNDSRNDRGPRMRRDIMTDNDSNFAAPKSLAELKNRKNADGRDEQLTGKRKYFKIDYEEQAGDDLSFEGPKPLEEILKRKRGGEMVEFEGNQTSNKTQSNNQDRSEETHDLVSTKNGSNLYHKSEDYEAGEVKRVSEGSQSAHNTNDAEVEEGMIEDGAEDHEQPEPLDHGDEEFDYEQGDGDNYNLDEGENGDAEEEYLDDDDDEFAKKMGVMY